VTIQEVRRLLVLAIAGVALVAAGTAYMAANDTNQSSGGEGVGSVTVTSTAVNGNTSYQVTTPDFSTQ
jgi:hypothetical protein